MGITAARRAAEQAALVRALGGEPLVGPAIGVDVARESAGLAAAVEDLIARPPAVAVFITGIGGRHLVGAADAAGRGDELRAILAAATVIARGPKARRALAKVGVEAHWSADPAEVATVREHLLGGGAGPLSGRRVMVQCVGAAPEPMVAALAYAGADVVEVRPYRFASEGDAVARDALAGAVAAGEVAAVTFTSALAVEGFAEAMDARGHEPHPAVLMVAVGPVTRRAMLDRGWRVDVEPAVPKMGTMYRALASALGDAEA
ncbi:MAG: uroporphyrinogen-III synthase [Miltoncostaeaceae bacterium]